MNRTDRLYAIAEELRSAGRGGCTGERLAARFEVSGRTIKRDIDALLQAGAPIWAQSGPAAAMCWTPRQVFRRSTSPQPRRRPWRLHLRHPPTSRSPPMVGQH